MPHGFTSTKKRGSNIRYITIADNIPEHWDRLIDIARTSYNWYAYIFHDGDSETANRHIHLLCFDRGGTTLKSHCSRFEEVIPSNFVNIVVSPRAMARYLIHLDDSDKQQFSASDVITSSMDKYLDLIRDGASDSLDLWHDFVKLRTGALTPDDFIDKYRGELCSMPMYQRFSMYTKIFDQCGYTFYNHHASLSSNSGSAHPPELVKQACTSPGEREDL